METDSGLKQLVSSGLPGIVILSIQLLRVWVAAWLMLWAKQYSFETNMLDLLCILRFLPFLSHFSMLLLSVVAAKSTVSPIHRQRKH